MFGSYYLESGQTAIWVLLGQPLGRLGRSWSGLGGLFGALGRVLGALGAVLETSWALLERSWSGLGGLWARSWQHFADVLIVIVFLSMIFIIWGTHLKLGGLFAGYRTYCGSPQEGAHRQNVVL